MTYRFNPFTGTIDDTFITRNEKLGMSSGIISGGAVSINSDPAKIDVMEGKGLIVDDWTDPNAPIIYNVEWPTRIAQTVTYLATASFSIIGIDKNSNITQFAQAPTAEERRKNIILVTLAHTGFTQVNAINPRYNSISSPINQLRDLIAELQMINKGNVVSYNGANLKLNRSAGSLFGIGLGYLLSQYNPNDIDLSASTAFAFQYRTQVGAATGNITDILPDVYDVDGVATAIGGGTNRATNQRVFLFPNGNVRIQYGQIIYNSLSDAAAGLSRESFNVFPNIRDSGILLCAISVIRTATNLSLSTEAIFHQASMFGELFGGGGTSSGVTDHLLLSNIGTMTHVQIETELTRLAGLSISGKVTSTVNNTPFI